MLSDLRSGDRARVAGYLRSARYEQDWEALGWREGYTDMLGVLADYGGRGVAPALLTAAMRAYQRDGMEFAAAGVDSDSPTGAVDLYRELGYAPTQGSILYAQALPDLESSFTTLYNLKKLSLQT